MHFWAQKLKQILLSVNLSCYITVFIIYLLLSYSFYRSTEHFSLFIHMLLLTYEQRCRVVLGRTGSTGWGWSQGLPGCWAGLCTCTRAAIIAFSRSLYMCEQTAIIAFSWKMYRNEQSTLHLSSQCIFSQPSLHTFSSIDCWNKFVMAYKCTVSPLMAGH